MRHSVVCAAWVALAIAAPTARGESTALIRIGARSVLSLSEVDRRPSPSRPSDLQVVLRAELRDGPSRAPLPSQPLTLGIVPTAETPRSRRVQAALAAAPTRATTDPDGAGVFTLALPPGGYQLTARYGGDPLHDSASAELPVSLSRLPVQLSLTVPERISLGTEAPVALVLRSQDELLAGAVALTVAGKTTSVPIRDGAGALRLRASAGAQGSAPGDGLTLTGVRAGQELRLAARYDGDETHGPAQAEATVLVTTRLRLDLTLPAAQVALGDEFIAFARVSDDEGPREAEPIELLGASAPPGQTPTAQQATLLASGTSDAYGRLRLRVPLPSRGGALREGQALLFLRARSRRSFRLPATSNEATLTVLPQPPHRIGYYLLPPLCCGLLLLLQRALQRHAAWLHRLRPPVAPTTPGPGEAGVHVAPQSRLRQVLAPRADEQLLSGVLTDAALGGPIAGALCQAFGDDDATPLTTRSDAAGRFQLGPLPARARITFEAEGYVPLDAPAPARGARVGVRVALTPIRIELLRRFRALAPGGAVPIERTPREAAKVHAAAAPRLAELLPLLESSLFSDEPCTLETLRRADALAAAPARDRAP